MNWYKKAQAKNYPTWLAKEIQRMTDNYQKPLSSLIEPKDYQVLEDWVKETNPDLSNLGLGTAIAEANIYQQQKRERAEELTEEIRRNWNRFIAESQNIFPDMHDFAVDLREKYIPISTPARNRINKAIHALGNYHTEIPLQEIFDILKQESVVVLQEDGRKWSGLLVGGAECGSKEAEDQRANFILAVKTEKGYMPSKQNLILNWCKMPSGKYEIVSYVA